MSSRPPYWGNARSFVFQHRAFVRLEHARARSLGAATLACALTAAWLAVMPLVLRGWTAFLLLVNRLAGSPGDVVVVTHRWGALDVPVPHLSVFSPVPAMSDWGLSVVLVLALVWIAPRLPDRLAPLTYVFRALALIHVTAMIAFTLQHIGVYTFPYSADAEASVLAHVALFTATLVPAILGFTYYVQDTHWRNKVLLTVLTLGFFALFLPVLTAFHALFLHATSLLWLPLLFLVLGVPTVVFLAISLYALGMSWESPTLDAAPPSAPWQPGHAHARAVGRLDAAERRPRRRAAAKTAA